MRTIKACATVLLIALAAILLWEAAWTFLTPTRFHARYFPQCEKVYARYAEVLSAVLPRFQAEDAPEQERQMLCEGLSAYVKGETPEDRIILIPVADIGDFYRQSYTYGLVWAADLSRLIDKNPGIILTALENGWCAYCLTTPQ